MTKTASSVTRDCVIACLAFPIYDVAVAAEQEKAAVAEHMRATELRLALEFVDLLIAAEVNVLFTSVGVGSAAACGQEGSPASDPLLAPQGGAVGWRPNRQARSSVAIGFLQILVPEAQRG